MPRTPPLLNWRMDESDIGAVEAIDAVPHILEVACKITGLGFAAVARVTEQQWVALAVRDQIGFGLKPGSELQIKTTICDEIRQSGEAVIIDHVACDPRFKEHPTPTMYGFESYISVPIILRNGEFFGTLCAIDPNPAKVSEPSTVKTFELFAELLALHLENRERVAATTVALLDERRTAEQRDQFIAVLGHDLRNPLAAISAGTTILSKLPLGTAGDGVVQLMQESCRRMAELTGDILDFARGKMGGGVPIRRTDSYDAASVLIHVIEELRTVHFDRDIRSKVEIVGPIYCDVPRLSQLLSNLLANALTHGAEREPVTVAIRKDNDMLILAVHNAGEPIPVGKIKNLFKPFTRGSSRSNNGLGLGLYIAREIAKAHGGELMVVSDETETVFTAEIPCRFIELNQAAAS